MSRSQDEPPYEFEKQFILRLPLVRNPCISGQISSGHKYQPCLDSVALLII